MRDGVENCVHLVKERYDLDLSVYDYSFLEKAIKFRMTSTLCEASEHYLLFIHQVPDELSELLSQLNNSYSEFFRNSLTFSFLEQPILRKMTQLTAKDHSREIRIWSAGCASGQEPYSLAMVLDNFKKNKQDNFIYRIFATDNSEKELDLARKGIFNISTVKNTRFEFTEKYFIRKGETFLLDPKLKEKVDFSNYDLLSRDSSSPPSAIYGDFDLIMCCNVLIYYQPFYQQIILQKFFRSLRKGGFLITGEAEAHLVWEFGGFKPYSAPAAIFVKN